MDDESIGRLISDMIDTMRASGGVGLAAPQIGVGLRVFTWEYTTPSEYDKVFLDPQERERNLCAGAVINPRLDVSQWPEGPIDPNLCMEGCLSIPGLAFPVRRGHRAVLTGLTPSGEPLRYEASGWLARIFQHEFDHLEGVVFLERLDEPWATRAVRAVEREGLGGGGVITMGQSGTGRRDGRTSRRRGPHGMRLAGRRSGV